MHAGLAYAREGMLTRGGGGGGDDAALYFGDHFLMGGQRFPALQPDAFLFGELGDLNFLTPPPGPLGPAPPDMQHTTAVTALVHVRKDTLRLVRAWAHNRHLVVG